jgi:trimethylamine:corrinoid methyltransferase-like protein
MMQILKSSDIEVLIDGVLDVLEKQGFRVDNKEILDAYQQGGAVVDRNERIARFPRKIIKNFTDRLRKEDKSGWIDCLSRQDRQVVYSGFHPYNLGASLNAPPLPYMFHNLSTYFYDDETHERRLGNKQDFIRLIKLGDTLHPQEGMGHALNLSDMPSEVEPLEAALVLLEYSHKPRGVYVHNVRQIEFLREIEDIFGITDPYWHWMANICPNSPLKLDQVVAERFVYMVKSGLYPAKLASMPVCGVNIPVTLAGTVVIIAAEYIALWFAARLLQSKQIPLVALPVLGTMDIRTGNVSFSGFDVIVRRFAICDFIRRWTGVQLSPGPGEWTATKTPGMYCSLEKAYYAMMAAAFTGHHPDIGVGHIDNGLTISCVQLLLDYDLTRGLKLLEFSEITKEQLCLESIFRIGFGLNSNYMDDDCTLANLKSSLWIPELISRNGYSAEIESQAFNKCKKKVDELKASYVKPRNMEDKLARSHSVIERAKKILTH